ncbi:MAG: hypothetical protein HZB66_03665 [Candidatus Aenigmarchaeota archaeon]|nr:hypothetical protein [Candidatus Aenigmarchaeota archaeon]
MRLKTAQAKGQGKKRPEQVGVRMIAEFIAKNRVVPSDCLYHTNRSSLNRHGKSSGSIRVLVLKKDNIARSEYVCPECGHKGYEESAWKRPFYAKCEKCGFRISVPKLKEQIKKEMKAGK